MAHINKKKLVELAYARQELLKRYENERIAFYKPCCAVHGGRKPDEFPTDKVWESLACPIQPCLESKHMRFHCSRARNRIVFGGNRSSKTFTCTKEFIFRMALKRHPFTGEVFRTGGRHGRILAQDFSIHEKKHIPELYEWFPTKALAYGKSEATRAMAWDKSYDSRNHLLHLIHDGWIDFQTYEQDSSKGESVDLDIWFADEEIPQDWYSACNARLITRNGVGIMGVTPLYRLSWAMTFLTNINPNVDVFKWGIRYNPHNSDKAINDFLVDFPALERRAREHGEFIEFGVIVYKELDSSIHYLKDFKFPSSHCPVILAVDPHPRKPTVCTWALLTPHDDVIFFDELEVAGTASDIVKAIRDKEAHHKFRTELRLIDPAANKQISGIGSSLTTLREFENVGMGFTLADNNEAGYNVVHEYLQYDHTKPVSSLNRPRCYFTSDVPKTWEAMTALMWDEWMSRSTLRDEKERVRDFKKDFPDCVRYTLAPRPSARYNYEPISLNLSLGM